MEHTRLKNMAICKRKLPQNLSVQDLVKAINALDVNILNMDTVELLQRMVPLEEEIKKYREFTLRLILVKQLISRNFCEVHYTNCGQKKTQLHALARSSRFSTVFEVHADKVIDALL